MTELRFLKARIEAKEDPRKLSIDFLDVPVRAWNCLRGGWGDSEYQTLGDVCDKTASDLLRLRNFGKVSLAELEQALAKYGLSLRKERRSHDRQQRTA